MTASCRCTRTHERKRVVITGGPGAGKTAVLEMLRHTLCPHIAMVPESAAILFGGGFPRAADPVRSRAAQRAIFHVQLELEAIAEACEPALTLCDRGIVDGYAYWPGPDDYWMALGIAREAALARYHAVIHLRTPNGENGYGHQNPLRTETAAEAAVIDSRLLSAWDGHARRFLVEAEPDFLAKAERAIALIRAEIPKCCRVTRGGLQGGQADRSPG